MGDIVKINLKDAKRDWNTFITKCLTECYNYNDKNDRFKMLMHYEYDSMELINAKEMNGILNELKSVSLDKEEYMIASASDEEIIANFMNTLKYSPDM